MDPKDTKAETKGNAWCVLGKDLKLPVEVFSNYDVVGLSADLESAKEHLKKVTDYVALLFLAYKASPTIPPAKYTRLINNLSDKILTSLTHYRLVARSLAIRSRTTQETYQTATSLPTAELAKLERLYAELEKARGSVNMLVAPDYSVFGDLNMISREELEMVSPELFKESDNMTAGELQHRVLLAQMTHESERRRTVMKELEDLEREKKSLYEQVRKGKELMNMVTLEVDKTHETLKVVAHKLNIDPEELKRDLSEIEGPILDAFHALQDRETEETPVASDVEMPEPAEPDLPQDLVIAEFTGEPPTREEGEASDEGEEEAVPT